MRRLPGSHAPNSKNRSSKHLSWLTKMKPVIKSISNEQLKLMSKKGYKPADVELNRRLNKKSKKESK